MLRFVYIHKLDCPILCTFAMLHYTQQDALTVCHQCVKAIAELDAYVLHCCGFQNCFTSEIEN